MPTHVTVIEEPLGRMLLPHRKHARVDIRLPLVTAILAHAIPGKRPVNQMTVCRTDKTEHNPRAYSLMQNVKPAPSEYSESFWKPMWR